MKKNKERITHLEIEGVRFPVTPEQAQALQFCELATPTGEAFTLYEVKCSACGTLWRFREPLEDCAPCPSCLLADIVDAHRAALGLTPDDVNAWNAARAKSLAEARRPPGCLCHWEDDHTYLECEKCRTAKEVEK